jgi:hypothetical protein
VAACPQWDLQSENGFRSISFGRSLDHDSHEVFGTAGYPHLRDYYATLRDCARKSNPLPFATLPLILRPNTPALISAFAKGLCVEIIVHLKDRTTARLPRNKLGASERGLRQNLCHALTNKPRYARQTRRVSARSSTTVAFIIRCPPTYYVDT